MTMLVKQNGYGELKWERKVDGICLYYYVRDYLPREAKQEFMERVNASNVLSEYDWYTLGTNFDCDDAYSYTAWRMENPANVVGDDDDDCEMQDLVEGEINSILKDVISEYLDREEDEDE